MTIPGTIARMTMELAPAEPPAIDDPRFSQIFDHSLYINGTGEYRKSVRRGSSQYRFEYERDDGMFDKFFPDYPLDSLRNSQFLDLGCLTGGRTAAWVERYGISHAVGFDIDPEYVTAASEYAEHKKHSSNFCVSLGEQLPFADETFDAIATFDVVEHVQSVNDVMAEAFRVLRPGGLMFAVFPTYYNPLASHLNLATRIHGLNLLFPGKVLAEAHYDVIRRRGDEHQWYNSDSADLPPFYKAPFLNGVTVKSFREVMAERPWIIEHWPRKPIFTVGRRMQTPLFRTISNVLRPLAKAPLLEEVFLTSISVVLRRPES